MMAEEIAEDLEDGSIGTVGTDIYVNNMPDTPDKCFCLIPTPGLPPDNTSTLEMPGLVVMCRDTTSDAAELNAYAVLDRLHKRYNVTIETFFYPAIEAVGSPFFLTKDEASRYIFQVQFQVYRMRS